MEYLLIEHVERGHGSSEDIHRFNSLDKVYEYIKDSRNLFEFFILYTVNEIKLDKNILDATPNKTTKKKIQYGNDVITFECEG